MMERQHGKATLALIEKCSCDLCEAERERRRESARRRYRASPERQRETARRWQEANPERAREINRKSARRRQEVSPERRREAGRRYYVKNRERFREATRRYRARKLGVISEPYTLAEIAERGGYVCAVCGRPVDVMLPGSDLMGPTVDHVIPLSWGGPDIRANVQLAHRVCNTSKGDRISEDHLYDWTLFGELPQVAQERS